MHEAATVSPTDTPLSRWPNLLPMDGAGGDMSWARKWQNASEIRLSSLDQPDMYTSETRKTGTTLTKQFRDFMMRIRSNGQRPTSSHSSAPPPVEVHVDKNDESASKEADERNVILPTFPLGVLNPRSGLRLCWDLLLVLAIWYSLFVVSFRVGFESTMFEWRLQNDKTYKGWGFYNSSRIYIEYIADVIFMINFVLQCRTAYFRKKPGTTNIQFELEVSPKLIFLHYIKSWFVLDLACAIPFEAIYNLSYYLRTNQDPQDIQEQFIIPMGLTRFPRILLLLRLRSMFRVTRVPGMDRYVVLPVIRPFEISLSELSSGVGIHHH